MGKLKSVLMLGALGLVPQVSHAIDIKVSEDVTLSLGAWLKAG